MGDIHVFVSSCKCYSRLVNVCHGFVPSCFCYFCHSNVFHAHACHAIVCHAIVTSCKCLSCKRDHVNERHTSASSRVPRWLHQYHLVPARLSLGPPLVGSDGSEPVHHYPRWECGGRLGMTVMAVVVMSVMMTMVEITQ